MITLGIDTSNYTTSAATWDGSEYKHERKILSVKEGMRGIRQSEGVFIHNKVLPGMIANRLKEAGREIGAVGVSTRPRSLEGSYMPVFTVGHGYARAVAAALGARLYEFSHQDGHIMAGVYSADAFGLLEHPFISVHLSGGTTEILKTEYTGCGFINEIIGGTLDISAGQLIDRIGVAMGMRFPCGKELEGLADKASDHIRLPLSVKDSYMNFSGAETKLMRMITGSDPVAARTVLVYIRDMLISAINSAVVKTGLKDVLVAGGVAANGIIREGLERELNAGVHFASAELSGDNAVGVAILAALAAEG